MNVLNLEVKRCTKTENGDYMNKLQAKTEISVTTPFGEVKQERQVTYYLFTKSENEVGAKHDLDISLFDVVEQPFTFVDEDSGAEETIMLKKLYAKGA